MRRQALHGLASALGHVAGPVASHRERCLRCQADDAKTRALARELSSIGSQIVPAPEWLVDAVLADLDRTTRARSVFAFASGTAAAAVAVAATAIVLASRRRTRAV